MKKKIVGELRLHRDGYGFVTTGDPEEDDVFIPARYIGDALHTDLVEVEKIQGKGKKFEGRILNVVERRVKRLVGRLENVGRHYRVAADDLRIRKAIIIPQNKLGGAKHGQNVIVKILKYPEGDSPMQGEIMGILGKRGELETEKQAIIVHHHLPHEFSKKVLEATSGCSKIMYEDLGDRIDLRNVNFVTIDGENAKDFDDAVAVRKLNGDVIRLWVSIADVSHFVPENYPLDAEAYKRGTSVYFPGSCIPMLPEVLSNNLCSLKPNEDRLTLTAEMDIGLSGEVVNRKFYKSIIKSRERMTYTAVKGILVEHDEGLCKRYKELIPDFKLMKVCFNRLRKKKVERGSIDFDLPEPEIVLDLQGAIDDIVRAPRHVGHMIIEEFMIAANESVAEFLTERNSGCIYRVHEPPQRDKIYELSILLNNLGYKIKLGDNVTSKRLAHVVEEVEGKPEGRLINTAMLRSLAKAVYSDENIGHYGLASDCYCHFTSPIRRYPDLVVHRILKRTLKKDKHGKGAIGKLYGLGEIAEHCSRRERIAMEAERDILKMHVAFFMKDKVGEKFDGIISHVTKFGFFVELNEVFVEGLVHKDSLPTDKYVFDENGYYLRGERTKVRYRIGDPVRVVIEEVNVPLKEVFFTLTGR